MIMVAERNLVKTRRIFLEKTRNGFVRDFSQRILLHRIPDIEKENAVRLENAMRFLRGARFVWDKHDPELAEDGVEGVIGERQIAGIGLLPFDRVAFREFCGGVSEHPLLSIRRGPTCSRPPTGPGAPGGEARPPS